MVEKKDGGISLFVNDKGGNDKRPDYKGTALIGGIEYEVALWNRVSQKGTAYLSGSMKVAENKPKVEPKDVPVSDPLDDDIPL
jgi:uncharacterized protein (DUF736 family)